MEENMILVNIEDYTVLCQMSGRVEALKNYINSVDYLNDDTVIAILGLDKKKGEREDVNTLRD